ncbi:MAG: ferrous iron transport protein B [Bacteroidota bacterium]
MTSVREESINKISVALVGNPNSGKTTLFNSLTGLNQRTGNFPGVTVDKKTGYFKVSKNRTIEIIDLPGTYSLYPKSIDEQVTFKIITNKNEKLDVVVVVADSSNFKRAMFLLTQVIDLNIPCVLALNMIDVAQNNGIVIDSKLLATKLGIPVVEINSKKGVGLSTLKNLFENDSVLKHKTKSFSLPKEYAVLSTKINSVDSLETLYTNFVQLINDKEKKTIFELENNVDLSEIQAKETLQRFDSISSIYQACVIQTDVKKTQTNFSKKLDDILTHKVWGLLIFGFILFTIFQAIFNFSAIPMDWIETFFANVSSWFIEVLPQGILTDLFVNGIIAGISGIVVFVPQIAFLFAFIVVLEDTGYMARVSFMMDRVMRFFGLSGRSIIPLIGGIACAVPSILSTRTISNWKERMITIMVTPLMSCSARLPVYTLLISLTVPNIFVFGFIQLQGLVFFLLYFLGTFLALLVGLVLKKFIKSSEGSFFVMEMPLYKLPRPRTVLYTIYEKVKVFLFDAGKVIFAVSVVLWFLTSFGPSEEFNAIEKKYATENKMLSESLIEEYKIKEQSEKLEASYAGIIGKKIEPLIAPIGYDWKIGIAIITSFAAREVFVGTMATIYSAKNTEDIVGVRDMMAAEINPKTGQKMYSLALGASLLVFYAFSMQCISTIAVVYRETKHWKWPLIQFVYMGVLAYLSSYLVYHLFS